MCLLPRRYFPRAVRIACRCSTTSRISGSDFPAIRAALIARTSSDGHATERWPMRTPVRQQIALDRDVTKGR